MNKENIQRGLSIFLEAMRQYAVSVIMRQCDEHTTWDQDFESRITHEGRRTAFQHQRMQLNNNGSSLFGLIDYNNLETFIINYRNPMLNELAGSVRDYNRLRTYFGELKDTRNKWAHFEEGSIDQDEEERAFSNMIQVAKLLEMSDLEDEIKRIKGEEKKKTVPPTQQVIQPDLFTDNTHPTGNLPSWFNCIRPQYDIRSGNLDESVFAANIEDVAMGTAPVIYQDIVAFFDRTYITDGMKDLVKRVVQALNGKESQNRVISLQTGFGGGKTHSLISLYHLVKDARIFRELQIARDILEEEDLPRWDEAHVAVFTQNTVSIVDGHEVAEGITTHTLWGELAWQLGGREGYERVRNSDEQLIAPTAKDIKPILEQAKPALILIDELADYCSKASGKMVGSGTLFTQTNSFIQTLTEAVAATPGTVLICTLPASATEVANSEIGQEILTALENRVVRVGASVKPVDDEEIYEVVRRRLFDKLEDEDAPIIVARKYKETYHNRRDVLPQEADRVAYAEKIKKAYPFHPELIDMFRLRWGSDSRFQRTRGVLRLLASIVKDLWTRRSSLTGVQALIHTSDVQMANLPTLQSQITGLMGAQWDSVMHADVIGTSSNAYKIDEQYADDDIGKYHLATSVMTTLLLSSVGATSNKGLTVKQIKLCMLRPESFKHLVIDTTLAQLENVAHYMYRSSIGGEQSYWFQSKPNINILINQAKGDIKEEEVDAEILRMAKNGLQTVNRVKTLINPSGDVPELKQLTFVLMHPSHAISAGGGIGSVTKKAIKDIAQQRGTVQRVYRNTMLFLICSEAGRAALATRLKEYLACEKITNEYGGQLDADQRKDVVERKRLSEQGAREQLIHAYNTVIKCERDDLKQKQVNTFSNDFASQITDSIMNELHEEGWVLRRIGLNIINRNGLMPTIEKPVKVKDLYEAFLRFDDKPMLLNVQTVTDTVNRYCSDGMWNVGTGTLEHFSRIYHEEQVPFLNPTEDDYWLLDPSIVMIPTGGTQPGGSPSGGPTQPNPPQPTEPGNPAQPNPPQPTTKKYKKVTIEGNVPLENYSQLFSSFINTLKNNHLKIKMRFTAESTETSPLTENAPLVKSITESASQLGLDIEFEEET